mmetsp:Transcript_164056/g.526067  ORF Transcript_164056/g.526067 Transcript_164056/m.526067 type:complete len:473 (-) Transcript_164056:137-1555(-)
MEAMPADPRAALDPADPLVALDGYAHAVLTAWGPTTLPSRFADEHLQAVYRLAPRASERELLRCARLRLVALLVRVLELLSTSPGGPSAALFEATKRWVKEAEAAQADWAWDQGLQWIRDIGEDALNGASQVVEPACSDFDLRDLIREVTTVVGYISLQLLPKVEWLPPCLESEVEEVTQAMAEAVAKDRREGQLREAEADEFAAHSLESVEEPDLAASAAVAAAAGRAVGAAAGGAEDAGLGFAPARGRPRVARRAREAPYGGGEARGGAVAADVGAIAGAGCAPEGALGAIGHLPWAAKAEIPSPARSRVLPPSLFETPRAAAVPAVPPSPPPTFAPAVSSSRPFAADAAAAAEADADRRPISRQAQDMFLMPLQGFGLEPAGAGAGDWHAPAPRTRAPVGGASVVSHGGSSGSGGGGGGSLLGLSKPGGSGSWLGSGGGDRADRGHRLSSSDGSLLGGLGGGTAFSSLS